MKKIYVCLLVLILFTSCDYDTNIESQQETIWTHYKRQFDYSPANSSNPYDAAGIYHNELLDIYYEQEFEDSTVTGIAAKVDSLATLHAGFQSIKNPNYLGVSVSRVMYILNHESSCLNSIISTSFMSTRAKTSLSNFISSFLEEFEEEEPAEKLCDMVKDYETTISKDSLLTSEDKKILFTTTSIIRFSSFSARKKPKKNTDKDWTVLIGGIAATVDSSDESMAKAITMALTTGIAQNRAKED